MISPLLANIALHGLEEVATHAYRRRTVSNPHIRPQLVRYADDFVILCSDLDGIEAARVAVEQFLGDMGLTLNPRKTRITHTLHDHNGQVGFEFLGFAVRQLPAGKTQSGKKMNGQRLGFKTIITPSKEAVKRHMASIGQIIRKHKTSPQGALIDELNPVIRGWAQYYRAVVAKETYSACDSQMFAQLLSWASRRHPHKSKHWIASRYWSIDSAPRWAFVVKEGGRVTYRLRFHRETSIRRHAKVAGQATPYDGNLIYWARRLKDHPLTGNDLGRLLAKQKGRCLYCGLTFHDEDLIEIDHIVPTSQGGTHMLTNRQALHRHCHDQKTAGDRRGGYS